MGAHTITRSVRKEQKRVERTIRRRLHAGNPVPVTVVQNQSTKHIVGVGLDRAAAERVRSRAADGEHCELFDFFLEV